MMSYRKKANDCINIAYHNLRRGNVSKATEYCNQAERLFPLTRIVPLRRKIQETQATLNAQESALLVLCTITFGIFFLDGILRSILTFGVIYFCYKIVRCVNRLNY